MHTDTATKGFKFGKPAQNKPLNNKPLNTTKMTNTNSTFARLRGKLVSDRDAQTFQRIGAYTKKAVFLLNLRTQKQTQIDRLQFIKWVNVGALNILNP